MKVLTLLIVLILSAGTVSAQHGPPNYGSSPSYTYCEALAYDSGQRSTVHAYYIENWLQASSCNNGGNNFYGNTIKVQTYFINQHTGAYVMGPQRVFWYDWSADPHAGEKLQVWGISGEDEPLLITYDPVTLRALTITSSSFP
jgi:hypothetical protein